MRLLSTILLGLVCGLATLPALAEPDAASPRRLLLSDPALAADAEARHRLKYLASCALGPDVVLVAEAQGQRWEFPGNMGLTPEWAERALTPQESRWLSACILARTNYFAANVLISMRNPEADSEILQAAEGEAERFLLYEGAYFGDIFAETPTAYACTPPHQARDRQLLEAKKRVCALPSGQSLGDGRDVTTCGFISVGVCQGDAAQLLEGQPWQEVIHVWLELPVME